MRLFQVTSKYYIIGIVQKVFSEKVSAITRMRQKCVKHASKMRLRQNGSCLLGEKRSVPKCVKHESNMRRKSLQKCAEHLWGGTPFGRYRTFKYFQRKTKGVENSGEGKTYHKWTPPLMIRFASPFVHSTSFSLEETGTDQTNPTF